MENQARAKSRKVQITLNDSLNHRLARAADRSGVTKSAFVRVALEREFALEQQLAIECSHSGKSPTPNPEKPTNQPYLFKI